MQTWFLAQVKPNGTDLALRNLSRQGFTSFLPRIAPGPDARTVKPRPLFPGYVFVAFDPDGGRWRSINSTQGVSRLVQFGDRPAPVPQDIIDGLRARCDDAGLFHPPIHRFQSGDRVEVTSGPFADFTATVIELDADRRVWVLMDLMGRATRMRLTDTDLKPRTGKPA